MLDRELENVFARAAQCMVNPGGLLIQVDATFRAGILEYRLIHVPLCPIASTALT
jgi:hypothetical protein